MGRFVRAVALAVLAGCSSSGESAPGDAGGSSSRVDARRALIDAGGGASGSDSDPGNAGEADGPASSGADASDARGSDAGARDAGVGDGGLPAEARCFEDVELVTLRGGRESFEPIGVFERDAGWVVVYSAFALGSTGGRFAAFVDRMGRVTATQTLGAEDVYPHNAQLGAFVLSWQYGRIAVHEIGEREIVARPDLVDRLPPASIESVEAEGDRLRVLSATRIDPSAGNDRFAYSELMLDDNGELRLRSGALPAVETLGSPGLVAGLERYQGLASSAAYGDTFLFAFPTGERMFSIDGDAWNVMRVTLDRSGLESGSVGWALLDETRWEDGPSSVFGAFPDLELVVAGRFFPTDAGGRWPAISVERFADPDRFASIALNSMRESSTPELGPARVMRRGDSFGVHTAGRFRVYALPSFEPLTSVTLELTSSSVHWSDDALIEVGGVRVADGLVAMVRCHAFHSQATAMSFASR